MELQDLIVSLKSLLEKEKEILIEFPIKNVDEFMEIQEKKRQLLLEISKYSKEELSSFQEEVLKISELNSTISALLMNHISFFEEFEKELFGEKLTYRESEKKQNLFNGRI